MSVSTTDHEFDNLVRGLFSTEAVEVRADTETGGTTLFGHFSKFDVWYRIDSRFEGTFMERTVGGAFADTIATDLERVRVLYDHGADPELGNKPLGPISVLREDDIGPYYEVPLYDTGYNRDFMLPVLEGRLMDGTRAGSGLGASFRFNVLEDRWEQPKRATAHNPDMLPERTILRTRLHEFGPVTFGASPAATSGVRSLTDEWRSRLLTDPRFVARFTERAGLSVVEKILASLPADGRAKQPASETPTDGGEAQANRHDVLSAVNRARLALLA